MRILVTGGAGYIGSHTALELLAKQHDICILDNFRNSSPECLRRIEKLSGHHFSQITADVSDSEAMEGHLDAYRPDAVIHFAGLKAVGESAEKPVEYYDVNVSGTINLLRAMDRSGCRKIIFSSSATVYGRPEYLPFDENHPCAPENVYGRTKHMAEKIIQDWQGARSDSSAVLLRYFNPVGAHDSAEIGEDPTDTPNNLLPYVSQVAIGRRDRVSIFGADYETRDGTGMRDYIHVVDLARAHVAALELADRHQGTETINVGTGAGHTVREMIDAFSRASGRDIPYVVTDRRPGDIATSIADPSKAYKLMGWKAERTLDEMCTSTWAWQQRNPNGFRGPGHSNPTKNDVRQG
ncbi:UDP-glucose 4-epimerase [Limimaricola soesokkakensis]|uniref:UDP-glucose 4-epimerase n=1 Tax=Limimaricola soesokkakensis TaxID=1343159 RepID=A0A1X7A6Y5_9RHOB|nr:UDP-glucose 4-epimerase GalE [Limimaricola soesokkakensis]SLN72225.1 UDP-glucose 4-epimerase [Limimaricola soesokkakensis]